MNQGTPVTTDAVLRLIRKNMDQAYSFAEQTIDSLSQQNEALKKELEELKGPADAIETGETDQ